MFHFKSIWLIASPFSFYKPLLVFTNNRTVGRKFYSDKNADKYLCKMSDHFYSIFQWKILHPQNSEKTIVNLFTICLFVLLFFRYSLLTPYRKTQQGNYVIQCSLLLYRLFCSTFLENNYQESYCVIFKNLYIVVDWLNNKKKMFSQYFKLLWFQKNLSCH